MQTLQAMLRIHALVKRYGPRPALQGLSLALAAQSLVVLLGPNGAGKSTLFQVLTGLFVADEGEVEVNGISLARQATKALRHIGVVFQQMSLDLDLSVLRNLRFHADLHGLPRALAAASASPRAAPPLGIAGRPGPAGARALRRQPPQGGAGARAAAPARRCC